MPPLQYSQLALSDVHTEEVMIRLFALLVCLAAMPVLNAQEWPVRPVRVIVNVAPGGVADVSARVVGAVVADSLKQPFVIDNRAGGEGYIGFEAAARAEPDGYTLLFSPGSSMMITPHIVQRKDFAPVEMFVPVAPLVRTSLTLVVLPTHPARTLQQFIDHAKANPGKMNYGSAGTGSGLHISAELFKRVTGIQATHVPYKGAGPALKDLLGGVFEFMFDPGTGLGQVKAGKLRALAVVRSQRHPALPDVPTLEEAGIHGVDSGPYHSFYAPLKVPAAIVQRLNAEITKAVQTEAVRLRLEGMGLEIGRMTPDEFAAYVRAQNARYAKLIPELK
jgi:tripartite-type tricarboxylate transporter receptor subunit TctC